MPSTNGHGPKTAVLYARVSTDEQARSGYSLAQQIEALREYATREGYEVLEEVSDPGQSGASLLRPGLDHVRDLVQAGGVSVVLAQDRDRLAREPAYLYLLREEFGQHGTTLRALNDRGDESPEGQLTDGILDQIARYEKMKIAERSRRGKIHKARSGKVIAGRMAKYGRAKYGFTFNEARDALEVDEEAVGVIRRLFYLVGVERKPLFQVKRIFDAEGILTATGNKKWAPQVLREYILSDVYKAHTFEELREMVAPEVLASLDPEKRYGVWWYNRRRSKRVEASEPSFNGTGKIYRKREQKTPRPREEWIAVPVPDAGISREWVEAARDAIKDNRRTSNAGRRFWELSGGLLFCGECGWAMSPHTTPETRKNIYFYYHCAAKHKKGKDFCTHSKNYRALDLETKVWHEVSEALKNPEQLRADMDATIEKMRKSRRGDPHWEAKVWLEKLTEADRKEDYLLDLAADTSMPKDKLRTKLSELEQARVTARRELENLKNHTKRIAEMEHDRDTLLESMMDQAPEVLDSFTPEDRQQAYKMLRVKVQVFPDGSLEITGLFKPDVFCNSEVSHL